jgi:hypothetical protein
LCRVGERRVQCLGAQAHFAADEFQIAIAHQRAGKQAGFHQDLETVADAQHQSAVGGELRTAAITGENLAMAPQRR